MDNSNYNNTYSVINIRTVVWDLLSQWKAVLIAALIMAVAVTGMKYLKDSRQYNSAIEAARQSEEQAQESAEDRIENILAGLSEEDRSAAEFVLKEKEWVRLEKDYMSHSILMNVDPTNQRVLALSYKITSSNPEDLTSILYGYIGYLKNPTFLEAVGKVIDPGTEDKYISELIKYDLSRYVNFESDITSTVFEISVIIPDYVDAAELEQAITASLTGYSADNGRILGEHEIVNITSGDYIRFDETTSNARTNMTYSIYNIQNNIKNGESSLSDEAKAAIASIEEILSAEIATDEAIEEGSKATNDIIAPSPSKKYAALGFILGVCLYVFIYVLYIIMKGRITSPADVSIYTRGRLFGEAYYQEKHKGITTLLHSNLVDRIRYKGKLDENEQTERIAESISAVCEHANIGNLTALIVPDTADGAADHIETIINKIREEGIEVNTIYPDTEGIEKSLLDVDNAIFISGKYSKICEVIRYAALAREYDVRQIGNIYVQGI